MTKRANPTPSQLARRFLDAIGERDLDGLRAIVDEGALFWTNLGQEDVDRETRLARVAMEFSLFETFTFEAARIDEFADGFVVRASARGSLGDGQRFEFPVCIVGETRDGRIVRLEEYVDSGPVAPILGALAGAASG